MLGRANCELLTPAIKECRLVSVCPPTARPPPITCTRQPRRAPFSGQLAHSLCATNRNCNASRNHYFDLTGVTLTFFQERLQQQEAAHEPVCNENFIRIDYVIESPKVSGDDRSV